MAKSKKSAAESTVSVRMPVDLVDLAREVSEETEAHPLGKRTYAEVLALAARAGMQSIRDAAKSKRPRKDS
jgi:hypothetical protein